MRNVCLFFIYVFTASSLFASSKLDVHTDYDRETHDNMPTFDYNWAYNEMFSSGILYKNSKVLDISSIPGYNKSLDAVSAKEWLWRFNLLTALWRPVSNLDFQFGMLPEYRKIKKQEFGYFQISTPTPTLVDFRNNVTIEGFFPYFRVGMEFKNDLIETFSYADTFPTANLKVSQDVTFDPIVSKKGSVSDSKMISPGAELTQEITLKTSKLIFFDIYAEGKYSVWTAKYDVNQLKYSSATSTFHLAKTSIRTRYIDKSIAVRFIFNAEIFGNVTPYVGAGYGWSTTKDLDEGNSVKSKGSVLNFGFKYKENVK